MPASATDPRVGSAPRSSLEELRELAALRNRLREALQQAAPTLLWFAKQQKRGGMPANIWKNLDRLPAPRMHGLSPAFDLMHALQRLERTVRQYDEDRSKEIVEALTSLKEVLDDEVNLGAPSLEKPDDVGLIRLLSDDRTGTLTMESAARVLRCGSFPIRIPARVTYIAGHVIFSELRLIRAQFEQFGMSATVKRAPSAAFVAQGVAAVHSFTSMVRKRANTCAAIARDLERIIEFGEIVEDHINRDGGDPEELTSALAAQERFLFARLANSFRRAGVSILGWRQMFAEAADEAKAASAALPQGGAEAVLKKLAKGFADSPAAETANAHKDGMCRAKKFVERYADCLEQTFASIGQPAGGVPDIEKLHRAQNDSWAPTITHTARVRILQDLGRSSSETAALFSFTPEVESPKAANPAMARALAALEASWNLFRSSFSDGGSDPDTPPTAAELDADDRSASNESWIRARSLVFATAEELAKDLKNARNSAGVAAAFRMASNRYRKRVAAIEKKLVAATRWAPLFAERLLFGAVTSSPDRSDPLDLLSALWICDRTGHAWPETLEDQAAAALAKLQRADGSFEAGRPPVKWVHGFVMLPPSAATIGVLANYLGEPPDGAPQRLTPEAHERRLARWEPTCVRAIEYLLNSRVGTYEEDRELSGWHSDRQPEDERIDLFTTCVATRALCEMDAVLSRLINRRAFEGMQIDYPDRTPPEDLFAFDCRSQSPIEDERPVLIAAQHAAEWLSYHTKGFARPKPLPPEEYKPRTTLYYGPPGTGKTNASKVIAGELRWPLVTVNPHHFLRDGDQFIGKVAAEIFERLQFASNCCVIFDEFDQLIVDRNIQHIPSQFAMVTTTMLPLLADLHERAGSNNCLIAFATNYHPLLDGAAIRHGRIDQQSCIVYPDYASRYLFLLSEAWKPVNDARAKSSSAAKAAEEAEVQASPQDVELLRGERRAALAAAAVATRAGEAHELAEWDSANLAWEQEAKRCAGVAGLEQLARAERTAAAASQKHLESVKLVLERYLPGMRDRALGTAMRAVRDLVKVARKPEQFKSADLWPSPALGPGHYVDMLQKLSTMKGACRRSEAERGEARNKARAGLQREVARFVTSLGPETKLATIDAPFLATLSLGDQDVARWHEFFHPMMQGAAPQQGPAERRPA